MRAMGLFVISMWLNAAAYAVQDVEIWTYDTLPPLAFKNEQGELTGVYVEIVKAAVARMPDYTVSFRVAPWARVKKAAEQGKAFAILPPYFHAHDWLTESAPKRPYLWPYSLPLFTQQDALICNQSVVSKPLGKFPQDYRSLRFVMWRGDGRAGQQFLDLVEKGDIRVDRVNEMKGVIPVLLLNRADCAVVSKIPFHWYIKQMKNSGEYQKFAKKGVVLNEVAVISQNEGHLGYTDIDADKNFPYKKDFAIKFDIEIYKMGKEGTLQAIVDSFVAD